MPITSSASGIKAGTLAHFAGSTAPPGWLKANGAAISRTAYAALFAAIGTTFGAGNGATTFNVPDCRGEFLRGLDDGRGVDAGRVIGTAQGHGMESHNHGINLSSDKGTFTGWNAGGARGFDGGSAGYQTGGTQYVTSVGGTETRPRNIAMLACIKY